MSIQEYYEKIKAFFMESRGESLYITIVIFTVALLSFLLGRVSVPLDKQVPLNNKVEIVIDENQTEINGTDSALPDLKDEETGETEQSIVASKNGTKYYLPYCTGQSRINEENKIWFNTEEEAQAKGYTKSATCKDL